MSSDMNWAYLALSAISNLGQFAFLVVGMIYALGKKREYPRAANLVIMAMVLMMLSQLLGIVFTYTAPRVVDIDSHPIVFAGWNLVSSILWMLSVGLLLKAVFVGRSPGSYTIPSIDSSEVSLADRADDNPYAVP